MRYGPVGAAVVLSLGLAALSPPVAAQMRPDCTIGRGVVDDRGGGGTIVGGRDRLCLVKYEDGRTHSWVPADQLRPAPPRAQPAAPAPATGEGQQEPGAAPPAAPEGTVILRPTIVNRLIYRADALGHVILTADVNGAPVRFLVDTGASLVGLSAEDAKAAGIDRKDLTFNQTVHTANGNVPAAFTQVRRIRIDQLEIENVPAAVIDNLKQSVLGMSFLKRVKGFDMRDGVLTISW